MGKVSSELSVYAICETNKRIIFQKLSIPSYQTWICMVRKVTSELGIYTLREIDIWVGSICPSWAHMWALCTYQSQKEHTCPIQTWFFCVRILVGTSLVKNFAYTTTRGPVVWFSLSLCPTWMHDGASSYVI